MREIKFRAWNVKEKIMIDWSTMTQSAFNVDDAIFLYLLLTSNDESYELMQFTGLKDKNRVDIYEGDIITCDIVEGLGEPRLNDRKEVVTIGLYGNSITVFHANIKVIGNVHQNPELL